MTIAAMAPESKTKLQISEEVDRVYEFNPQI
jgi:hypothetical protein